MKTSMNMESNNMSMKEANTDIEFGGNAGSLWGDAWLRLRKNTTAVIGLIMLAAILLTCVSAPLFIDYNTDVIGIDFFQRLQFPPGQAARYRRIGAKYSGADYLGRPHLIENRHRLCTHRRYRRHCSRDYGRVLRRKSGQRAHARAGRLDGHPVDVADDYIRCHHGADAY